MKGKAVEKLDAIDLLLRAGRKLGLSAMAEYPVVDWDTFTHGRIDCAWFKKGERSPIAVFEVEGVNVYRARRSLEKDLWKFKWSDARHKVVLLYTHRDDTALVQDRAAALTRVEGCISRLQLQPNLQQNVEVLCFQKRAAASQLARHVSQVWKWP